MDCSGERQRQILERIAVRSMTERGLLPRFSPAVAREVAAIAHAAPADGSGGERDLRALLWCSIDNDDSMDLDQLSASEALADGGVKLLVAVADVDALVPKGSEVDGHARALALAFTVFPFSPSTFRNVYPT